MTIEEFLDQPYVEEILKMMVFELSPIAHVMQYLGDPIPCHAEEEQAHVMRWLLKFAASEGPEWRKKAGTELGILLDRKKELEAKKNAGM